MKNWESCKFKYVFLGLDSKNITEYNVVRDSQLADTAWRRAF